MLHPEMQQHASRRLLSPLVIGVVSVFGAARCCADAVFYHAPELCAAQWFNARKHRVRKAHARQLAVMMSMESVGYYECFNNPAFMAEFDFEMSYRQDVRRDLPPCCCCCRPARRCAQRVCTAADPHMRVCMILVA